MSSMRHACFPGTFYMDVWASTHQVNIRGVHEYSRPRVRVETPKTIAGFPDVV